MSNPLKIEKTALDGVLLITPPTIFEDFRGGYLETYNEALYRAAGIDVTFVQDNVSTSKRNVLRGIHGDTKTYKLISCLYGKFYMVVVNCDAASAQFGRWMSFTLSNENRRQVLVPPKHGLAHLILSDMALFGYKQSTYYDRASQFTYRYDDPRFRIDWPVNDPILSERDKTAEEPPRP